MAMAGVIVDSLQLDTACSIVDVFTRRDGMGTRHRRREPDYNQYHVLQPSHKNERPIA